MKFYGYNKCSTCIKAKKQLQSKKLTFEDIDITLNPPSKATFTAILKSKTYTIKDLFNKSGEQYRALNMKDKINKLSESELLDMLASNGRLVKRPIVTDGKTHTVGYDEPIFKNHWK